MGSDHERPVSSCTTSGRQVGHRSDSDGVVANMRKVKQWSTVTVTVIVASVVAAALIGCSGADETDEDASSDSSVPEFNFDMSASASDGSGGSSSGGSSSGASSSGGSGSASGSGGSNDSGNSSSTSGDFSGPSEAEVIGENGEPGSCQSLQIESSCAGELYEGEVVPLDLYVMFDQSGSMATVIDESTGEKRIDAVASAMQSFLLDWRSAGIGVGLGHFGHFPLGETSCNENDYADPLVPIERLPDNASLLVQTLYGLEPTGETPTAAGIRGACSVTSAWKDEHPGTVVANLLVTDGEPKAPISSEDGLCDPTLEDAVAAATECVEAGVPTYVLGVGPLLDNLDQIAEAGDTDKAHLVAQDSSEGVLAALNAIRGDAQVPCEIEVPEPDGDLSLNYDKTDVVFMDSECVVRRIARVADASGCDNRAGGWYFSGPSDQRSIMLCDRSCADVRQPDAQFFYSVGCGIETIY